MRSGSVIFLSILLLLAMAVIIGSTLDYHGMLNSQTQFYQKFLICFSFQRNCGAIFDSTNRVDPKLEVLNGIRVLSIAWVILGHGYYISIFIPLYNFETLYSNILNNFSLAIIKAGTTSVDVFFFLSGFLAALQLDRVFKNPQNHTLKNVLLCYFHRYVRLFPWMLFVILVRIYIQPILYNTPNSFLSQATRETCEDQWYWALLYINNFITKSSNQCCGWIWYLMIDMQLFLIMPIVMILYNKSKKAGLISLGLISLFSLVIQTAIIVYNDLNKGLLIY